MAVVSSGTAWVTTSHTRGASAERVELAQVDARVLPGAAAEDVVARREAESPRVVEERLLPAVVDVGAVAGLPGLAHRLEHRLERLGRVGRGIPRGARARRARRMRPPRALRRAGPAGAGEPPIASGPAAVSSEEGREEEEHHPRLERIDVERGRAEGGRDGHEQDPRGAAVTPPERPGAQRRQGQEEPRRGVPEAAAPVDGGQAGDRPAQIPELAGRQGHEVVGPEPLHVQRRRPASRCPAPRARRPRRSPPTRAPAGRAAADGRDRGPGTPPTASAASNPASTRIAGYESHGAIAPARPRRSARPWPAPCLSHRQGQDDQQERDRHVRRVGLYLGRVEDEGIPVARSPRASGGPRPGRKDSPGDVPAERQRREAPEERDQTERVLALPEDHDGELLERRASPAARPGGSRAGPGGAPAGARRCSGRCSPRRPTARRRPRIARAAGPRRARRARPGQATPGRRRGPAGARA